MSFVAELSRPGNRPRSEARDGVRPPARAFDRAERKFDPMAELGTDLLLVSSSTNPEALGCVDRIASRTGMRLTLKARAISSWRSCTPEARLPCTIASLSASWTMSAADRDREASVA